LALALLLTGIAQAQPWAWPPPRTWAQERVERLAQHLGLTPGQKQQALAIYTALEQNTRPLERQLGKARRNLRAAVKTNPPESQVDKLAEEVGELTAKLAALETKADISFYALLTPEQREKFDRPFLPGGEAFQGGPRGEKK
jgi:Spy/CpxP family protein refolding chaperone